MQPTNVFDAESRSVYNLNKPGLGYYIPAYQRPYSWDEKSCLRLVEDCCEGIRLINAKSGLQDVITFIGTLIVVQATQSGGRNSIVPIDINGLPTSTQLVIDGQQRLTTILLMCIELHSIIKEMQFKDVWGKKVPDDRISHAKQPSVEFWFDDQVSMICNQLEEMISIHMGGRNRYPALIRAYDDCWSKSSNIQKYESPIACYISNYIQKIHQSTSQSANQDWPWQQSNNLELPDEDKYKKTSRMISSIRKIVIQISGGNVRGKNIQIKPNLLSDKIFKKFIDSNLLFQGEIPENANTKFRGLFRLLVFSQYFLHRVMMAVVTANNELYAFDMFDSLNTTGQPLTAYETFRPQVMRSVGPNNFNSPNSIARIALSEVECMLAKAGSKKDKVTKSFLTNFALAEDGVKLGGALDVQRDHMRAAFEKRSNKEDFLNHLACISSVCRGSELDLDSDGIAQFFLDQNKSLAVDEEASILTTSMIKKCNHSIVIPLIGRFLFEVRKQTGPAQRRAALVELDNAIKIISSFSILWRAAFGGTSGIDRIYRKIMSDGGFSRYNDDSSSKNPVPNANKLKQLLAKELADKKISSYSDWIPYVQETPIYKKSRPFTQIMLYIALSDTTVDVNNSNSGLVVESNTGFNTLFSRSGWIDQYTIEHVAPEAGNTSQWPNTYAPNEEIIHTLGNLTLLPGKENSSISNRTWVEKKLLYSILSAPSQQAAEKLASQFKKSFPRIKKVSDETVTLMQSANYLGHLKPIADYSGTWNKSFIEQRTRNLGSILWKRLAVKYLDL